MMIMAVREAARYVSSGFIAISSSVEINTKAAHMSQVGKEKSGLSGVFLQSNFVRS